MSRVIVVLKPGATLLPKSSASAASGTAARPHQRMVVEVPNALRKLAEHPCVKNMHYDRKTGGEMNRVAVTVGARAVQAATGTTAPASASPSSTPASPPGTTT